MARTYPDVEVTNTGQPLVAQIEPVSRTQVAQGMTPQLAANVTVTISQVSI